MTFFQSNIQTGILVLLVILVGILCIALFFTNKEVRNIKVGFVKNIHDIEALQNLLDEVGLTAAGNNTDNLIDNKNPISSFNNMGNLHPSMFNGMFPPGMEKKYMNIEEGNEDSDDTNDTEDIENTANTEDNTNTSNTNTSNTNTNTNTDNSNTNTDTVEPTIIVQVSLPTSFPKVVNDNKQPSLAAKPSAKPAAKPSAKPAAKPAAKPSAKLAAKLVNKPVIQSNATCDNSSVNNKSSSDEDSSESEDSSDDE
jgi:hypothetical protein